MLSQFLAQHRGSIRQFIKFGITGTVGAIVDFSIYNLLTRGLGWTTTYEFLGTAIIAANVVSVFSAIACNFVLNKYWTFNNSTQNVARQGAGYAVLNLITFILNQLVTSFFVFHVAVLNVFGSQKDNAAKALAIGLILFVNFFGSKFLIFRKNPAPVVEAG